MVAPRSACWAWTFDGIPLVTADGRWPYRSIVQTEVLRAVRVDARRLRSAFDGNAAVRTALLAAAHLVTVQIAEGLASAAWQRVQARLARWLLMYRDRLRSDRIPATHEFLALMIGAQRTGITLALHELEGAGMIVASRGLIVVRDAAELARVADGGYGIAEAEQARLL